MFLCQQKPDFASWYMSGQVGRPYTDLPDRDGIVRDYEVGYAILRGGRHFGEPCLCLGEGAVVGC